METDDEVAGTRGDRCGFVLEMVCRQPHLEIDRGGGYMDREKSSVGC